MKIERHILKRINFVKLGVNETIEHAKEKIGHVNKVIQYEELESNNETNTWSDKDKQTLSAYDIKSE